MARMPLASDPAHRSATQLGEPLLAQPVGQGPLRRLPGRGTVAGRRPGQAAGPAGLEDDGRHHAGEDGGLGPGQDVGRQRLGDQEIGLVVDAGQPAAGRRQRPALQVAQLLEHGDPVAQLNSLDRRSARCACHWAKERCRTALAVSRSKRETRLTARL
jgi:hypothetical protein